MESLAPTCPNCGKPTSVCVCDLVVPHATRIRVLVLQHPQEQDRVLGTVPILRTLLSNCQVRVGLSWPSLAAVADGILDTKRWAVVFPGPTGEESADPPAVAGLLRSGQVESPGAVEGVVLLDGSWSQAKTLWWRNPWLLKLKRLTLTPTEPSIYGHLRREPNRRSLSTLEAAAEVLVALGEPEDLRRQLRRVFRTMVQRARDAASATPQPRRRPPRRKARAT